MATMTPKYAGDLWISERTKQLRYGGGSQDQWLQPISVYKVGAVAIKRGSPVSIKLNTGGGDTSDNVIEATNTAIHVKCLGLALEPGQPGEFIHVLSSGRFTFNKNDGVNTYFPAITDADRGKMLYVTSAGELTLDRNAALLTALNLIQIGYITNTTISGSNADTFDIELQLEGDGRGPLENTQFELAFGEPVTIQTDYPKLYAVSPAIAASKFSYKLRLRRTACTWPTTGDNRYNKWIAVYSANKAVILVLGPKGVDPNFTPARTIGKDDSRYNFITTQFVANNQITYISLYNGVENTPPPSWGTPAAEGSVDKLYEAGGAWFGNSLANAITGAYAFLANDANSKINLNTPAYNVISTTLTGQQAVVDINFIGASAGGPIYIEWDSALNSYFANSTYVSAGAYAANAGSVILADKRFPERSNLAGLYIGPSKTTGPYLPADRGIFLRKGLYTTTAAYNFVPGTRYFLGNSGNLIAASNEIIYPEAMVEIGTAVTTKSIMVDITAPVVPRGVDFPIGSIKPTPIGSDVAEDGFLLMNGQAVLRQEQYEDLYLLLVAAYGQGNIDTTIEAQPAFFVPNLLIQSDPSRHYQIKALNLGYQPLTSVLDRLYFSGTTGASPVGLTADITSLKNTGPKSTTDGAIPTIDTLVIKLFVEISAEEWREIPSGFYYSGADLWGYVWKVVEATNDGETTYTLTMDIGSGLGLGYLTTSLTGKAYQLVIYKPEMFARYYNVGAEHLDPSNNFPPTSVAVYDYIDTSVSTKRLWVRGEADIKDKLDFHLSYDIVGPNAIHNPLLPGVDQHDACARLGVTDDGVIVLSNTVASTRNALGIASKTGGGDPATAYIINNNTGSTPLLEFSNGTTVGTPENAIVLRAAAFQTVSTIIAKENIKPFTESALNLINETAIVEYNLISDPDTKRVGFIAENTNELMAGKNHDQMDLSSTVGILMKAVQELSEQVNQLKSQMK